MILVKTICSNTLLIDGITIVTTAVTIKTTTRSTSSAQQSGASMRGFTATTAMLLFAGMLFTSKTRRMVPGVIALIALALAFGGLYGCGNGSTTPESHGTPAGVYTITINASSAALVHTTSLRLTVN
jgi:hypothetical protein